METQFKVGKHNVEIKFEKTYGSIQFIVDGKVLNKYYYFGLNKRNKCVFGDKDLHTVELEISHPLFLALFRKGWKYTVYLDGKPIKIIEE